MASAIQPVNQPPLQEPFEEVDEQEKPTGFFSRPWVIFWERQASDVQASRRLLKRLTLDVSGPVGTTPFALGELPAGLYWVSWNARVKTPAGVSSDATISVGNTDGTVVLTWPGDLLNLNTTVTKESQATLLRVDKGTSITYAIDYHSNPVNAMHLTIDFLIEAANG